MSFMNRLGNSGRFIRGGAGMLLTAGALAYGASDAFFVVDGGQRAVLFSRIEGVKQTVYDEGFHLKLPWLEWPTIYDIRAKPKKISSSTGTRDLQTVNISLRVLYRPNTGRLPLLHQRFGPEYDECALPSLLHETLKGVIVRVSY